MPSPLIKALREVTNFIRRNASFLCGAKNRFITLGYESGRLISQASKLRKIDMLEMSQLFSKTQMRYEMQFESLHKSYACAGSED